MNDAYLGDLLDEVVAAEPAPAWGDVLRRARRARRRYALVAAVLATLVLAPGSWGVVSAFRGGPGPAVNGLRICGLGNSVVVTSAVAQDVPTRYMAGLRPAVLARPQSFYKIQYAVGGPCDVSFPDAPVAFYVPAASEVRIRNRAGDALWVQLPSDVNDSLRQAVIGLKAFPAPTTLAFAAIDDQSAAKPSTYLRLYTVGTPVRRASGAGGWLRILLEGPSSPWSDGWNSLRISRRGGYLSRDGQLVRIPAAIADRVRRAVPLR